MRLKLDIWYILHPPLIDAAVWRMPGVLTQQVAGLTLEALRRMFWPFVSISPQGWSWSKATRPLWRPPHCPSLWIRCSWRTSCATSRCWREGVLRTSSSVSVAPNHVTFGFSVEIQQASEVHGWVLWLVDIQEQTKLMPWTFALLLCGKIHHEAALSSWSFKF